VRARATAPEIGGAIAPVTVAPLPPVLVIDGSPGRWTAPEDASPEGSIGLTARV